MPKIWDISPNHTSFKIDITMLDSKLLLFFLLKVHDKIRISIIMHLVVEPAYVLWVVFEMSIIQDYEHGRPGQVCGMLPVPEDNLSSMIYLSSNGLFGPKWT